jgi:hypothetical protein
MGSVKGFGHAATIRALRQREWRDGSPRLPFIERGRRRSVNDFWDFVYELTNPINGQYPRPWMTRSRQPERSKVWLVGVNQATAFPTTACTHQEFVDSLFDPDASRRLYLRIRPDSSPSPTRVNIDGFVRRIAKHGIDDVLETNVVCYGTRRSAELRRPEHARGRERGEYIFNALLDRIRPRVLIVNGVGPIVNERSLIC